MCILLFCKMIMPASDSKTIPLIQRSINSYDITVVIATKNLIE